MAQVRFNQLFAGLVGAGLLGAFLIPPWITDRAKGKADVLLLPIVKPVRGLAGWASDKYGPKDLPPGETRVRGDAELAAENTELRQHVVFLTQQLESLRLVEAERKRLGRLLDYFKPVSVVGGDATPGRESLSIVPTAGVATAPDTPVMSADGLVGKTVDGGRVRLITDRGFIITGEFGRYDAKGAWTPISIPKASIRGTGNNTMVVDHLTVAETTALQPGDWVVVSDTGYPDIVQGRQLGQVEAAPKPQPGKPLFSEVVIKPRAQLMKLREVLVMRK